MKHKFTVLLTSSLLMLGGCSSDSNDEEEAAPQFTLAVSDAPVDALSSVVVCFNQIELKSSSGDSTFTVGDEPEMISANDVCTNSSGDVIPNTVGIDLLQYTGDDSVNLIEGVEIEAGSYSQLRLVMSDGSYAVLTELAEDGSEQTMSVSVPSNELKLDGFTATLGGNVSYTLEFDLRKAMTNPVGKEGYTLKPRGVRLVDNSQVGHISGTVTESLLLSDESCTVPPETNETPVASVYIYSGTELDSSTFADNGGTEGIDALASANVYYDGVDSYSFEIGFIAADSYTLALTCQTADDPDADDDINFFATQEVVIEANNTPQAITLDVNE